MADDKDRLRERLREKQKGDEDRYFAERDRQAIEKMKSATQEPAAVEPRCPRCGEELAEEKYLGVTLDRCPKGHGMWLDQGEFQTLADREKDSWLGKLFSRPRL